MIDHELVLETTTEEAFEIAIGLAPSPYEVCIKNSVAICGLTNIRIIKKVVRAVNRILAGHSDLSDELQARLIPSSVLLSAIYYKGLDDGPGINFVLGVGGPDSLIDHQKSDGTTFDAAEHRARWNRMLQELGIMACDEYERLVLNFLRSGQFDVSEVHEIVERYSNEAEYLAAETKIRQFIAHTKWHAAKTEEELLQEARSLIDKIHVLDAHNVTTVAEEVCRLAGGSAVGGSMIDTWVTKFEARVEPEFQWENIWGRPIHPRIQQAIEEAQEKGTTSPSLLDVSCHIAVHESWTDKHVAVMNSASSQDFEMTIKSLPPDDLRQFMDCMLTLYSRYNNDSCFRPAMSTFILACRNICADSSLGRLPVIIRRQLLESGFETQLN